MLLKILFYSNSINFLIIVPEREQHLKWCSKNPKNWQLQASADADKSLLQFETVDQSCATLEKQSVPAASTEITRKYCVLYNKVESLHYEL